MRASPTVPGSLVTKRTGPRSVHFSADSGSAWRVSELGEGVCMGHLGALPPPRGCGEQGAEATRAEPCIPHEPCEGENVAEKAQSGAGRGRRRLARCTGAYSVLRRDVWRCRLCGDPLRQPHSRSWPPPPSLSALLPSPCPGPPGVWARSQMTPQPGPMCPSPRLQAGVRLLVVTLCPSMETHLFHVAGG